MGGGALLKTLLSTEELASQQDPWGPPDPVMLIQREPLGECQQHGETETLIRKKKEKKKRRSSGMAKKRRERWGEIEAGVCHRGAR